MAAGDRTRALEAVDVALAIDPQFLAAQSLRLQLVEAAAASSSNSPQAAGAGWGVTGPARVSSENYARFEERAKNRRIQKRLEAARDAIACSRFEDASAAVDELRDLNPALADLPELTDAIARGQAVSRMSANPSPARAASASADPASVGAASAISASPPAGPTSLGLPSEGPPSVGPASPGPTSLGPTSSGPTSLGLLSAGPAPVGPTSLGPASGSPERTASASSRRWAVAAGAVCVMILIGLLLPPGGLQTAYVAIFPPLSLPPVSPVPTTSPPAASLPAAEATPIAPTAASTAPEEVEEVEEVDDGKGGQAQDEVPGAGNPQPLRLENSPVSDDAPPAIGPPMPAASPPLERPVTVGSPAARPPPESPATVGLPAASPPPERPATVAVSAAPSPPAPPPPTLAPPIDDELLVRQALQRYRWAYEELDADSARAVWPGVDRGALARAFNGLSAQTLTFQNCDVSVNRGLATAVCTGSVRYVAKVGSREPRTEPRRWTFALKKVESDWQIENARAER